MIEGGAPVMMALGRYRFSLDTAAYQSLQRSTEYRWTPQARIGQPPGLQYLGPGDEGLELEGVIYPNFKGGLGQVEAMRREAGKGQPLQLTDGLGRAWGHYVITRIEETQTVFFANGQPRRIEFRLSLNRYGEAINGVPLPLQGR
jgi:phage protein U